MRSARWLPLLLLSACGGRPGCSDSTRTTSATVAPSNGSLAPAPSGLGASDVESVAGLQRALVAKGPAYKPNTRHLNADGSPKYTNRLILQTSPYLLQHAHNPVNWYAWGEEAFARARKEGKPILLSVGYSTCHWCHVMEHESFEDEEVATFINQHFIAIKVDREERPDVDDAYMAAVQTLTGGGGWPMTLALTPDRQPFFGGTYFPARDGDRGASKGFLTIVRELASEYERDRGAVVRRASELSRRLRVAALPAPAQGVPGPELIARAERSLSQGFDSIWGGFGRAPKFPRPVTLELLLRYHRRTGDEKALEIVVRTLDAMARGGIYDQVGGGFHRYATDARWLVPHFEKMLYDNAQLVPVYLSAYQATGRDDFAAVARDTLDYVGREMTSPDGAFYSATDADSPAPSGHEEEGRFFTWTPSELELAVGPALMPTVSAFYGVTASGNFEGRNILHVPRPTLDVAKELSLPFAEVVKRIDQARALLYEARLRRPAPRRDDKILTSWNGLMISALARAALVLGKTDYQHRAERAASFALRELRTAEGKLTRTFHSAQSQQSGYLDDYSFLIQGLLDVFEASSTPEWLEQACSLQAEQDRLYWDDSVGGYFATTSGHEQLLTRDKPSYDGAEPAGNSVAILNLLRLADLTSDGSYRKRAEQALSAFGAELQRSPSASPLMLSALEAYLDKPREVILVSPSSSAEEGALVAAFRRVYLPNRFLVRTTQGDQLARLAHLIPSLDGKKALGSRVTAFVCEQGRCELPTTDAAVFAKQLAKVTPLSVRVPESRGE